MNLYALRKNIWTIPSFSGGFLVGLPEIIPQLFQPFQPFHIRMAQASGLFLLGLGFFLFVKSFLRHRRFVGSKNVLRMENLSWQQFETLLCDLFRSYGYRVDERGGNHADGGIDLIASSKGRRVLIQCKHWKKNSVGAPVVREIFGVMVAEKFDQACIATCGKFTKEAWAFAKGKPIRLLDGRRIAEAIAERTGKSGRSITSG